jgi:hypothetical protein
MQSEYASKYNTKGDAINLNGALLQCAGILADKTLSLERRGKLILSKVQNTINKAIVYPLTMSASYLLGHGDSWFPLRTQGYDARQFQRALRPKASAYDVAGANVTISPELEDDDMDVDEDPAEAPTNSVHAITSETMYRCRHVDLKDWSPFELAMAFECCPAKTGNAKLFQVSSSFPAGQEYGHKPLLDRAGKAAIRIPQLYCDAPPVPDVDADHDTKEDYAAFMLGNFYPFDQMDSDTQAHLKLSGTTLWDKLQAWQKRQNDQHPSDRRDRDLFAKKCIANLATQTQARLQMRVHNKQVNLQRRFVVEAAKAAGVTPAHMVRG